MRGLSRTAAGVAAVAAAVAALYSPAVVAAEPPAIPDAGTARSMLDGLTVAEENSAGGYAREKFPHWSSTGACTTRETVLGRDGTGVTTDAECRPTGSWYSPYDDQTVTDPAKVDIDHVVPLAEAWRSGAREWSTEHREQFANDLGGPQLIAVTSRSNRSKGDQDPAAWLPPNTTYHCTYARMWIAVKSTWQLSLQPAEKGALTRALAGC
jgi:hypothetical protein